MFAKKMFKVSRFETLHRSHLKVLHKTTSMFTTAEQNMSHHILAVKRYHKTLYQILADKRFML